MENRKAWGEGGGHGETGTQNKPSDAKSNTRRSEQKSCVPTGELINRCAYIRRVYTSTYLFVYCFCFQAIFWGIFEISVFFLSILLRYPCIILISYSLSWDGRGGRGSGRKKEGLVSRGVVWCGVVLDARCHELRRRRKGLYQALTNFFFLNFEITSFCARFEPET